MTITAPIYNKFGTRFMIKFDYEIEGTEVIVADPRLSFDAFGNGWIDDLVAALNEVIEFDFTLKIK